MLNVLLTNDDGIEAEGLQRIRRALRDVEGVRLAVIAPDGNRSAMARSITTRRPLWVEEVTFADGSVGYATDGTPVDCVRLASLGLVEDFTRLLEGRPRAAAGKTAPAHGLALASVRYPATHVSARPGRGKA